jgi:hypothetical protein
VPERVGLWTPDGKQKTELCCQLQKGLPLDQKQTSCGLDIDASRLAIGDSRSSKLLQLFPNDSGEFSVCRRSL